MVALATGCQGFKSVAFEHFFEPAESDMSCRKVSSGASSSGAAASQVPGDPSFLILAEDDPPEPTKTCPAHSPQKQRNSNKIDKATRLGMLFSSFLFFVSCAYRVVLAIDRS